MISSLNSYFLVNRNTHTRNITYNKLILIFFSEPNATLRGELLNNDMIGKVLSLYTWAYYSKSEFSNIFAICVPFVAFSSEKIILKSDHSDPCFYVPHP